MTADQTEREALVQTIASSLAMSYGSHVNAPKGGRDWRAAENLLGVLEHLGLRRIDPDDEALVERCARAGWIADCPGRPSAASEWDNLTLIPPVYESYRAVARAVLKAATS